MAMTIMSDILGDIGAGAEDEISFASNDRRPGHMQSPEEHEIAAIIFDSISDGVFTVDQDCRITAFNRAAETISGFSLSAAGAAVASAAVPTPLAPNACIASRRDIVPLVRVGIPLVFGNLLGYKLLLLGVSTKRVSGDSHL
jgi:PAS domain-containing protein